MTKDYPTFFRYKSVFFSFSPSCDIMEIGKIKTMSGIILRRDKL